MPYVTLASFPYSILQELNYMYFYFHFPPLCPSLTCGWLIGGSGGSGVWIGNGLQSANGKKHAMVELQYYLR